MNQLKINRDLKFGWNIGGPVKKSNGSALEERKRL